MSSTLTRTLHSRYAAPTLLARETPARLAIASWTSRLSIYLILSGYDVKGDSCQVSKQTCICRGGSPDGYWGVVSCFFLTPEGFLAPDSCHCSQKAHEDGEQEFV